MVSKLNAQRIASDINHKKIYARYKSRVSVYTFDLGFTGCSVLQLVVQQVGR
jgi:hypothetical protein